jgi:hypothetical protein
MLAKMHSATDQKPMTSVASETSTVCLAHRELSAVGSVAVPASDLVKNLSVRVQLGHLTAFLR